MTRRKRSAIRMVVLMGVAIGIFVMTGHPGVAEGPEAIDTSAGGPVAAGEEPAPETAWALAAARMRHAAEWLRDWYFRTPPTERVTWGGLVACGGLGLVVLVERTLRLRERKVVPPAFTARFVDHLHEGKLDGGQALDHCERNPSPAARVALAAVRRWGRPAGDLERAVAMAHRVETERLRQNVGTLRRVAALSALLGILGTLFALGRALESIQPPASGNEPGVSDAAAPVAWGPAVAAAITPLSTGLIIATLALVAYDGVLTRVETLAGALDRLGAETIEAVAMSAPPAAAPLAMARSPHFGKVRKDEGKPAARGKA